MDCVPGSDANIIGQYAGMITMIIITHSECYCVCVCVLLNLQVGLAVDDIKGIQETATLTRLALRVQVLPQRYY